MFKKLSFLTAVILNLALATSASATSWHPKPHLQVEGSANLELEADQVSVSLVFQAADADSSLAIQVLEQQIAPLIADLKRELKPSKDFAAGQINLQPRQQEINKQWQVVGYTASRTLSLINLPLNQASYWLEVVTGYKPYSLSLNYSSSQAAAQTNKLLEMAMQNARGKASALAKGTGRNLGKVLEIIELGAAYPVMRNYALAASPSADAKQAFNLVPNQQEISTRLRVIFELK